VLELLELLALGAVGAAGTGRCWSAQSKIRRVEGSRRVE
jgi:hypothetical protein